MDSLVSIIVPIYGVAEVLNECIESVVGQTYKNLEIILVDDGAADGSADICDRWAECDKRIKVIHQKNQGVSAARNTGIEASCGKYIMFVDGDDVVSPDYVNYMTDAMTDEIDFVMCNYYSFDSNHKSNNIYPVPSGEYDSLELFQPIFFGYYHGQRCAMSTSLFLGLFVKDRIEKKRIRFDTLLRKSEDWLFYSEYYPTCKKLAVVDLPLYGYRQFSGSVMHEYKVPTDLGIERSLYILKKFEANMESAGVKEELWRKYLQERYNQMVKRYALGVWDHRNVMNSKEKASMIKEYVHKMKSVTEIGAGGVYRAKVHVA
ncbi:MAG: glycosyltransferase [Lachnospiraceae bacterium]|nr:glycosyltransferase [Lachnospiraceae bacterium]